MAELQKTENVRSLWADALRSLCCLMVTVIHVSGVDWYTLPAQSEAWLISNAVDSFMRPAVVLFFMLSGSFMLRRDPEPKRLLFKLLRLALLWLGANLFYTVFTGGLWLLRSPLELAKAMTADHYHLWFLRSMICLYLLVPVLRALVVYQQGKWVRWLLGVFLLFGCLRTSLGQLPFDGPTWYNFQLLLVPELCQYSGYFLLGWYLTEKTRPFEGKKRPLAIGLYVLVAIGIAVGTYLYSWNMEWNDERLYAYMGVPTLVMAVCLFQLARGWREGPLTRFAARLAPLTLGVYVLHPLMIDLAVGLGLVEKTWPRALFIPALVGLIVLSSGAATWCLRRIPIVKKFL